MESFIPSLIPAGENPICLLLQRKCHQWLLNYVFDDENNFTDTKLSSLWPACEDGVRMLISQIQQHIMLQWSHPRTAYRVYGWISPDHNNNYEHAPDFWSYAQ